MPDYLKMTNRFIATRTPAESSPIQALSGGHLERSIKFVQHGGHYFIDLQTPSAHDVNIP